MLQNFWSAGCAWSRLYFQIFYRFREILKIFDLLTNSTSLARCWIAESNRDAKEDFDGMFDDMFSGSSASKDNTPKKAKKEIATASIQLQPFVIGNLSEIFVARFIGQLWLLRKVYVPKNDTTSRSEKKSRNLKKSHLSEYETLAWIRKNVM